MSHVDTSPGMPFDLTGLSWSQRRPPMRQESLQPREPVARSARRAWSPLAMSAGIDGLALASIAVGDGRLPSYVAAAAVHLAAVALLAIRNGLWGGRRILTVSLALALPFSGVAVAAIALRSRRRAPLSTAPSARDEEPPALDPASFKKIAEALAPCEVLSASGDEDRRATLAALTRRGDAGTVRLLRWLTIASPDAAVDAALALEELAMRFEAGLETRRNALAEAPSAARALDAGSFIAGAMASGLVEPMMLEAHAREARQCFALARQLEPARDAEVTLAWARMELAAMHPDVALNLVEGALERAGDGGMVRALIDLRGEVQFALHQSPGRYLERASDATATPETALAAAVVS